MLESRQPRLQETRDLHERIKIFENGPDMEYHRQTPMLVPTLALTAGCQNNAGINSIERYIRATGLAMPRKLTKDTPSEKVFFSQVTGEVDFEYYMAIPIKIPGMKPDEKPKKVKVAVFDRPNSEINVWKDMPIKLHSDALEEGTHIRGASRRGLTAEDRRIVLPQINVPKAGAVFDLYPFPSLSYDEGWTKFHDDPTKTLMPTELRMILLYNIARVEFKKKGDGQKRIMYCTNALDYVTEAAQPKCIRSYYEAEDTVDETNWQFKVWDVEIEEWRSFCFSTLLSLHRKALPLHYQYSMEDLKRYRN